MEMNNKKPYAVFIGYQENIKGKPPEPLYNIIGGPKNKSTVSAKTLSKEGIKVPTTKIGVQNGSYQKREKTL